MPKSANDIVQIIRTNKQLNSSNNVRDRELKLRTQMRQQLGKAM